MKKWNFKINAEKKKEDKEIQKILQKIGFKNGYLKDVYEGKESKERMFKEKYGIFFYTEHPNKFRNKIGIYTCVLSDKETGFNDGGRTYFNAHTNNLITIDKLRDKDFQNELRKRLILNSLE